MDGRGRSVSAAAEKRNMGIGLPVNTTVLTALIVTYEALPILLHVTL